MADGGFQRGLQQLGGLLSGPLGQGLLTAAATYAAGAQRGTPVQNIGRGLLGGLLGYQQARDYSQEQKEEEERRRILGGIISRGVRSGELSPEQAQALQLPEFAPLAAKKLFPEPPQQTELERSIEAYRKLPPGDPARAIYEEQFGIRPEPTPFQLEAEEYARLPPGDQRRKIYEARYGLTPPTPTFGAPIEVPTGEGQVEYFRPKSTGELVPTGVRGVKPKDKNEYERLLGELRTTQDPVYKNYLQQKLTAMERELQPEPPKLDPVAELRQKIQQTTDPETRAIYEEQFKALRRKAQAEGAPSTETFAELERPRRLLELARTETDPVLRQRYQAQYEAEIRELEAKGRAGSGGATAEREQRAAARIGANLQTLKDLRKEGFDTSSPSSQIAIRMAGDPRTNPLAGSQARRYRQALDAVISDVQLIISGLQATDTQYDRLFNIYAPRFGDDAQTAEQKIKSLEKFSQDARNLIETGKVPGDWKQLPDGTYQTPEGAVVNPDELGVAPATAQPGEATPEGQIRLKDGRVVPVPPGYKLLPDGRLQTPDGRIL